MRLLHYTEKTCVIIFAVVVYYAELVGFSET
jgi:hypothetical protein